jgi:ADP-ribose pyrophosphatase YjhB (NUDIX family)
MLKYHVIGQWRSQHPSRRVTVEWTASTRRIVPEVERQIERAWAEASAALGDRLFDGPMCRLEAWQASEGELRLSLSRTSYKPFLGTNLKNVDLAETNGPEVLANPVGVSTALQTADGYLLLGRRNDSVAYYPERIHPFAGALEPREALDVFDEVYRELEEELSLRRDELQELVCVGLVEDEALRQPELIFTARAKVDRAELERRLDEAEHRATWSVLAEREAVERAMTEPLLTPVAVAALRLWSINREATS